jgi:hypothetical protein
MKTEEFPVETVSWNEAGEFCRKVTSLKELKSKSLLCELPREAEWEYACRAGTKTAFWFGETVSDKDLNCADTLADTLVRTTGTWWCAAQTRRPTKSSFRRSLHHLILNFGEDSASKLVSGLDINDMLWRESGGCEPKVQPHLLESPSIQRGRPFWRMATARAWSIAGCFLRNKKRVRFNSS